MTTHYVQRQWKSSIACDIYCGPEVLFETCVAMKFMDDDDDDDDDDDVWTAEDVNRRARYSGGRVSR